MHLRRLLIILMFLSLSQPLTAMEEYALKAHYLCNFIKYTTWPAETDSESANILILGKNDFEENLKPFENKRINNRLIRITYEKKLSETTNLDNIQVLFIAKELEDEYEEILKRVAGKNILTIGEDESFLADGGIIAFHRQNKRLRFSVSLKAIDLQKIKLSSKLLKIAMRVK